MSGSSASTNTSATHVRGDGTPGFVTVIVDLIPQVDGTGPARLLDMVPGRSADVFGRWLDQRGRNFRNTVKITTMYGFTGYVKTAGEHLDRAQTVIDPFHVVHLAAGKLNECRRRIQNDTLGHPGRKGDPLSCIRRRMLIRLSLVTPNRAERLDGVLTVQEHVAVQVTWRYYQGLDRLIGAYGEDKPRRGKLRMFKLIKRIRSGVPRGLTELATVGADSVT